MKNDSNFRFPPSDSARFTTLATWTKKKFVFNELRSGRMSHGFGQKEKVG